VSAIGLSTLPRAWELVRLKWVLEALESGRREVSDSDAFEGGALSIGGEHIGWRGEWQLDNPRYVSRDFFAAMSSGRIRENDILLVKDGATIGKTAIATTLPAHEAAVNEHVFLLRVSRENDPKYYFYFVQSPLSQEQIQLEVRGSAQPGLNSEFRNVVLAPRPPKAVQRSIADFLDRETAWLDALMAAKERVLGLLAEKRRALITRAVTRGLDPDAPLRDSGIPWLGEIPAHWETRRVAWLFRERDERGEPDLPLMEVSINAGVVLREFSDERIESTAADFNTYKVARQGDVVFNKMRMWQGAVGVAPQDGLVSPDYVVAAPTGPLSPEYAGLLFRTDMFSAECAGRSHGIVWDRLRLYWEGFREIELPLPSADAQREIVVYVAEETAKLDALRLSTERTITLLNERRAALIAAAVTGQIKHF